MLVVAWWIGSLGFGFGWYGTWQGSGVFSVAITLWSFSFAPHALPVVSQVIYLELLAA